MKIIVKKPGKPYELCEVSGISEINKLVGNVDSDGNGYNHGGSDIREPIGKDVDMYVKEDAGWNADFRPNLWHPNGFVKYCGTVAFAGYDSDSYDECGACSLTDEQIGYCAQFIEENEIERDWKKDPELLKRKLEMMARIYDEDGKLKKEDR